ncbi:MAG: HlyD family efflux transporter periplasmic adaptor subunit [Ruminococcus sp.]|jgi:hypothetical protein|nr:HlyD family efflux transporter periplasmic adaptor subunit [Ruminococcus sp.]
MSINAKRAVFCIGIAIALSILILYLPNVLVKTAPVAEEVHISKKQYQDIVTVDGNIIREFDSQTVSVQMFVPEKEISKIRAGQVAEVRGDAFPDKSYGARITAISPTATKITAGTVSRTVVEVWAEIVGTDDTLKSGYTAYVTIKVGESEEKRLLPYEAVDQDENGEFVWVAESGKAEKRYIVTGDELPDGIEVVSGLLPEDEVIKIPEGVTDGDEVAVEREVGVVS